MWPDRVSNPGPLTYESGALPTALCGPAKLTKTTIETRYKMVRLTLLHLVKMVEKTTRIPTHLKKNSGLGLRLMGTLSGEVSLVFIFASHLIKGQL